MTLKESFGDGWNDFDVAAGKVCVLLGFMAPDEVMRNAKGVWWGRNVFGHAVHEFLEGLVAAGTLLFDEEECRFRWNPEWKGSWER